MTSPQEIGASLRVLRLARSWNLHRTAASARLQVSRLSDIETGNAAPSFQKLEAIVAVFGYPMLCFELARLLVRMRRSDPRQSCVGAPAVRRLLALDPRGESAATGLAVGLLLTGSRQARAPSTPAEVAVCLRVLRRAFAWSQRRAAAAARLPLSRLSAIECATAPQRDATPVSAATLEAIVVALGYPMVGFEIARLLVRLGAAVEAQRPRLGAAVEAQRPRLGAAVLRGESRLQTLGSAERLASRELPVAVFLLRAREAGANRPPQPATSAGAIPLESRDTHLAIVAADGAGTLG